LDLDLVDRRHDVGLVEQRREVLDHKVADPDGADLAVGEQLLQRPVRLQFLRTRRARVTPLRAGSSVGATSRDRPAP
jgi:hypothetical protein